jgi:hypothetical protein
MAPVENGSSSATAGVVPPLSSSSSGGAGSTTTALYFEYPVNSTWEMTLSTGETVSGTVYCTDEVSETVFLQKNLTHTTLATELFVVHVSQIKSATKKATVDETTNSTTTDGGSSTTTPKESSALLLGCLPKVQKKVLEEREKRAIRLAEESFRHINDKVRRWRHNNIIFCALLPIPSFWIPHPITILCCCFSCSFCIGFPTRSRNI